MNLEELQSKSFRIAEEHGFHKAQEELPPQTLALYLRLLLTIGELSEAAEELRAGNLTDEVYYEFKLSERFPGVTDQRASLPFCYVYGPYAGQYKFSFEKSTDYDRGQTQIIVGKPAGFPIELADALIRLADLAASVGVNLTEAVQIKEEYNRTREFLHGKTA